MADPFGLKGQETLAQGRDRRPIPWVDEPFDLRGLKGRQNLGEIEPALEESLAAFQAA